MTYDETASGGSATAGLASATAADLLGSVARGQRTAGVATVPVVAEVVSGQCLSAGGYADDVAARPLQAIAPQGSGCLAEALDEPAASELRWQGRAAVATPLGQVSGALNPPPQQRRAPRGCDRPTLRAVSEGGIEDSANLRWVQLTGTSADASGVVEQVRWLSGEVFGEDALEDVDQESLWEAVALLEGETLAGFVVYGVMRGTMSLRYIAVAPMYRGKGYGRRLVATVRQRCQEEGVSELSLFAKRDMVPFYCTLGFTEVTDEDGESEDDLQVPMMCIVPLAEEEAATPAGDDPAQDNSSCDGD